MFRPQTIPIRILFDIGDVLETFLQGLLQECQSGLLFLRQGMEWLRSGSACKIQEQRLVGTVWPGSLHTLWGQGGLAGRSFYASDAIGLSSRRLNIFMEIVDLIWKS
jgi:hypothetical protein